MKKDHRPETIDLRPVAALFVRADSVYKTMRGVDAWDADRDALKWPGACVAVAHPPCRLWSSLAPFSSATKTEKELGIRAILWIRGNGGVVEHPASSKLFAECHCPKPGDHADRFGGICLLVNQFHWGHRANKPTILYIVGAKRIPAMPVRIGEPSHCIMQACGIRKGHPKFKSHVLHAEREATPPAFARWLIRLARGCYMPERK